MNSVETPVLLAFSSSQVALENAGGKGLHLAQMVSHGFPVPDGFIISTSAYQQFIAANHLSKLIDDTISHLQDDTPVALEAASSKIRTGFSQGKVPEDLSQQVLLAFRTLAANSVAVRSSATAEDLPDLSFAGQQDTFLNVNSEAQLLTRVVDCWSSLWTARAIGYRFKQGVSQQNISLAVVVQKMVQSEASGVLFTANPLNGSRLETVIDATLGLGEALVSGLVEPDHYVVQSDTKAILSKELGQKKVSIRAREEGGVEQKQEDAGQMQALSDAQILELVTLGNKVQSAFGEPQDIEWGFSEGRMYLLQTRPITSLYPLPAGMPPEPLLTLVSFAAVQGLVEPLTPIGQSALKQIFAMGSVLFDVHVDETSQKILFSAGERLWVNFTPIVKNSFGRKTLPYVFSMVEPTVKQAVDQILEDPRLKPEREGISGRARRQMALFGLPLAGNVLLNLLSPMKRRKIIVAQGEKTLQNLENLVASIQGNRYEKLLRQSTLLHEIGNRHLGKTFIMFVSGVAAGMASWNALRMLSRQSAEADNFEWNDLVMEVTRGMPYNPTTEMDLKLWELAKAIRADADSLQVLKTQTITSLAAAYLKRKLPDLLLLKVDEFLRIYGGRGFCEIDMGRTRWAEDPTHVFEMLVNFVKIENEQDAPDAVFARGKENAEKAIERLIAQVRAKRGGFIKARQVKFFAGRVRQLMGVRENPKFFAVRMLWVIHRELLKTGADFVTAGELNQADDLFFLTFSELKAFALQQAKDWPALIAERRAAFEREGKRKQLPRLLLSDGRAFYEGMTSMTENGEKIVLGSPVSPGVVEGRVRVVRDPARAGLLKGEILVCPGTDPSWTPLFMLAGGLAMEVGGMMTHGAVVAREYGIPAIVGVHEATTRLKTGMMVRLNGSNGEITLLDD
jgi:pyruvate,water dikinase